jgi:urocanate hydratase
MAMRAGEPGTATPEEKSDPAPRQLAVYRKYLRFQSIAGKQFSGSLTGRMILCVGFGSQGAELALATTIAGGAFLGIESDSQRLKAAIRNGSCDFMVNTLDEALRVLKNELRKRTPLSAGLLGEASDILPAMVERGVQPDLIADNSAMEPGAVAKKPTSQSRDAGHSALQQIIERGAELLENAEAADDSVADEVVWTAANPRDMRRMDQIALEIIPPEDRVRRRWVEQAVGYFYRQIPLERIIGLHPEERTRLLAALKGANSSSAFQSPANVLWQSPGGTQQIVTL